MSKAFTKDDAWEDPIVAPRAPLPPGVPNYVTPRGLRVLREELAALDAEASELSKTSGDDDDEVRRRRAIIGQRTNELTVRIASAQLVEPRRQKSGTVRFGTRVTLRTLSGERSGKVRQLRIVGVDEADPAQARIAFVAPIARAILGCEVGEVASLGIAGEELLEVLAIDDAPEHEPDGQP